MLHSSQKRSQLCHHKGVRRCAVIVLLIVALGCGQKPEAKFYGQWESQVESLTLTLELRDDGTWIAGPIRTIGTWKLEKGKAVLTPERIGSKTLEEIQQTYAKQFGKKSTRVTRAMDALEQETKLTTLGSDQLTVVPDDPTVVGLVYKRVK